MFKLAINAVSAKRGGAMTYLSNMLPELVRQLEPGGEVVVWRGRPSVSEERWPDGIGYREDERSTGSDAAIGGRAYRLWFDQVKLPRALRKERFDALFSSSNFGPLRCPCRQVLLVRNPIYFDPEFMRRMRTPKVHAYYLFQRWLTLRCISASDVVLFPTKAMLDLVAPHAGGARANWRVAPYGTRHDLLRPQSRTREPSGTVRLLNVSIYSDQKNFATLLQAVKFLEARDSGRFKVMLTAGFNRGWLGESAFFPGFRKEAELFKELEARGSAEEVDWRTYGGISDLYNAADIFVFPSYTESFGHPLVEAMASGLPIVASDTPVNRELCGDAAVYFETFDARACATAIERVASDSGLADRLRAAAILRAKEFTWERHVQALIGALRN